LYDIEQLGAHSRAASFFSGGVDSFFTLLRHSEGPDWPGRINLNDIICIAGLDIKLHNEKAYRRMFDDNRRVAENLGKELIDIVTNIRDTCWWKSGYGRLAHGPGLAGIGLLLEKRYNKVLIPASHSYDNLSPWGSHVLSDPLLSTKSTKIINDGAGFTRVERTELVSKSDVAMRSLRVCWASQSDKNCQSCEKCYRTMITLMLFGSLNRCSTFDESNLKIEKIRKMYIEKVAEYLHRDIKSLALRKRRTDVALAIDCAIKRSKRIDFYLRIMKPFEQLPGVWRVKDRIFKNSLV